MFNFKDVDRSMLMKLVILHVAVITVSNALVAIPVEIFGIKLTWAAFTFPIVVVATDLTIRLLGKQIARSTIAVAYPFAILGSIAVVMAEGAPTSVALRIGFASATAYAIGLTDRFNAAVSAKPVINWLSKPLTADSMVGQIYHQFPGPPWEHLEHYWERSPLSLVGNVTTPTMLITGENDRRTPISETEQFYQALRLRGIDSAMIRIPNTSHGIASRPSNLITKVDHILAWFEKYKIDD